MNRVRNLLHVDPFFRKGYTGNGVGVAVLDTGIFLHGDLKGRVSAVHSTISGRESAVDDNGHGTHISGIIAGSGLHSQGKYRGMAPEVNLVAVKVLNSAGIGKSKDVERGIDWVIKNKEVYNIRIANISIGTFADASEEDDELIAAVNYLWDNGIVVVAASGNNGPGRGSITVPGSSRKVITVGASDDEESIYIGGRMKSKYSGCGPTKDSCIVKPEIVAPGSKIMSLSHRYYGYTVKSGTSMATPVAAGAIALLLQKYPDMSPKDVKKILYQSSKDIGLPKEKQGWGMIELQKMLG
ncbi:MAG: peptidase S8 [Lachnospiraceae bacterium]|nr:peptidase S8 [Lachnospiraceae bacterium]